MISNDISIVEYQDQDKDSDWIITNLVLVRIRGHILCLISCRDMSCYLKKKIKYLSYFVSNVS